MSMRARWRHVPAALAAFACLAPLVFVIAGSMRRPGPPPRTPELLPWPLHLGNYGDAFELVGFGAQLGNSLTVVAVAVPLGVLVSSAAGFGIARMPRRPRRALVALTIGVAMLPTTALLVGRFGVFRALGITDTLLPLMAPALLGESPFHVLVYLWAFRRLSGDMFDFARVEGLGELAIYRTVAMPMVWPITVAVAVASFVDLWGSYLEPLVYLSDPALFTVPLGIAALASLDASNQPLLLAGASAATLPVLVVVVATQRRLFDAGAA